MLRRVATCVGSVASRRPLGLTRASQTRGLCTAKNSSKATAEPVARAKSLGGGDGLGNNIFTWSTVIGTALVAGASLYFFEEERKKRDLEIQLAQQKVTKGKGRPAIGGPYSLTTSTGERVTRETFAGKFQLIYFGFTHCPDICPEELYKMKEIVEHVDRNKAADKPEIQPLFITIDPERDTPKMISEYVKEFHPRLIGMTGTAEEIKQAAKNFRIYYSKSPPEEGCDENDYLVDHIIICILLDPKGEFVNYYGQNVTGKQAARNILTKVEQWDPEASTE